MGKSTVLLRAKKTQIDTKRERKRGARGERGRGTKGRRGQTEKVRRVNVNERVQVDSKNAFWTLSLRILPRVGTRNLKKKKK